MNGLADFSNDYNYIVIAKKGEKVYYWCYDYTTEHKAQGALITRQAIRERKDEFDSIEVFKVTYHIFGNSGKWRDREQVLKWLYNDYLNWKKFYDDEDKRCNKVTTKRSWQELAYEKYLSVKNNTLLNEVE
jgi:hypothetical protein